MSAEKAEHADSILMEEFLEYLVEEYGFTREGVEEKFGYYL